MIEEINLKEIPIGPLKRGEFKVAKNITIIMGKPNSGKSYLLRSLHLLNWFYDEYARKLIFESSLEKATDGLVKLSKDVQTEEGLLKITLHQTCKTLEETLKYALESAYVSRLPQEIISRLINILDLSKTIKEVNVKTSFTHSVVFWNDAPLNCNFDVLFILKRCTLTLIIKGEMLCIKELKDNLKEELKGLLMEALSAVFEKLEVEDRLLMIPYDKDLLTIFWEAARSVKGFMAELSELFAKLTIDYALSPIYYSFWERMKESYVAELRKSSRSDAPIVLKRLETLKYLFKGTAMGNFHAAEEWIEYVKEDVRTRLAHSSGLAVSIASFIYTIATLDEKALILIEEPEVALHPEAQVRMILTLILISKRLGHKFVLVTHSPYVYKPLALLKVYGTEGAKALIERFLIDMKSEIKPDDLIGDFKLYHAHDDVVEEVDWEVAPSILEVDLNLAPPGGEVD